MRLPKFHSFQTVDVFSFDRNSVSSFLKSRKSLSKSIKLYFFPEKKK